VANKKVSMQYITEHNREIKGERHVYWNFLNDYYYYDVSCLKNLKINRQIWFQSKSIIARQFKALELCVLWPCYLQIVKSQSSSHIYTALMPYVWSNSARAIKKNLILT
jgi:hypothetical protein